MFSYVKKHMDKFFLEMNQKYRGPKFDAHVHLRNKEDIESMIGYSEEFNVKKMLGIMHEDNRKELDDAFPDKFVYAKFLAFADYFKGEKKKGLEDLEQAYADGYSVIKIWFAPRWKDYAIDRYGLKRDTNHNYSLNSPLLEPFFERLDDLNLTLLLHVSDPDLMYGDRYQPESKYGTKKEHLEEFKSILSEYPKLKIIGAHMAGQPEHLENLSTWLKNYPNLYVDLASAKWMVREFGENIDLTRAFFDRHADRILFGTDIVSGRTDREPLPGYYIHRYVAFQALLETDVRKHPLPIPDPDNDNHTVINGLNLSKDVLEKVYWKNSFRLFQ